MFVSIGVFPRFDDKRFFNVVFCLLYQKDVSGPVSYLIIVPIVKMFCNF